MLLGVSQKKRLVSWKFMFLAAVTEGHFFFLTHFRKEAKLSRWRQHARQVLIEEFNQLAVITPHQLLHSLCQERALVEGLEPNADEQPHGKRQFFQHDWCTLQTQMAFSNEGSWLTAEMGKRKGRLTRTSMFGMVRTSDSFPTDMVGSK